MRFVPVLHDVSTRRTGRGRAAFSAHSWLYCRREFGYQAAVECHALAVFDTERADCKALFAS